MSESNGKASVEEVEHTFNGLPVGIPFGNIPLSNSGGFLFQLVPCDKDTGKLVWPHLKDTDSFRGGYSGHHGPNCRGRFSVAKSRIERFDALVCDECADGVFLFPAKCVTFGELRVAFEQEIAHETTIVENFQQFEQRIKELQKSVLELAESVSELRNRLQTIETVEFGASDDVPVARFVPAPVVPILGPAEKLSAKWNKADEARRRKGTVAHSPLPTSPTPEDLVRLGVTQ